MSFRFADNSISITPNIGRTKFVESDLSFSCFVETNDVVHRFFAVEESHPHNYLIIMAFILYEETNQSALT